MGSSKYLPISEVFTDVEIQESIAVIKLVHEYYFPAVAQSHPQTKPDVDPKEEVKVEGETTADKNKLE